jgi:hypothetical protein
MLDPDGAGAQISSPDSWTAAADGATPLVEESPGSMGTRCRLTAGGGDPRDSATENKPPVQGRLAQADWPRGQGRNGAARAHRAPGNRGGTVNPTGSKTE